MSEHFAVENKRGLSPAALLAAGASLMEFVDGAVIATALSDVTKSSGVRVVNLSIGISAYLITLAILIPASGWIADRFDVRKVPTLALAISTLTSVLCGLPESFESSVAMRILQGIGGVLMVPISRPTVLRITLKHQLITATATLTWSVLIASIIGPPPGGFVTSYANRYWIFFVNVPLGILVAVLVLRFILDIHGGERRLLDIAGFIATSVTMVNLVYAMELLETQQSQGWLTAGLLALGTTIFLFALHHSHCTAWSMIRLDTMNAPTFRVITYGGSLFHAPIGAVPSLLPLVFQVGFGTNVSHAGSLVSAVFVGNLTIKPITTPLIRWLGFEKLLLINSTLDVLVLLVCALVTPQTPVWVILLVLYLGGMSHPIQFTGVSILAFAGAPTARTSCANTLFSTATRLTVGLGISLAAISIHIGDVISEKLVLGNVPGISFRLAFIATAIICLVGMVGTLRLTHDTGNAVSNKNRQPGG